MDDVVLMADPRVAQVPVLDTEAPLVDSVGHLRIDHRKADPRGAWRHLRAPVLERLSEADAALPTDLCLTLVEGFRPPDLQRSYFEGYASRLRTTHPDEPEEQIRRLASRYVSPVEIAPHCAGAAVDVTVTSPEGIELDLGCAVDDDPELSRGRCYTWHPDVTGEPGVLRRELAAAMASAGLVNYPTEWWHWSYGDRYWAFATASHHALFGPAELS